jgi:hypothetical protein
MTKLQKLLQLDYDAAEAAYDMSIWDDDADASETLAWLDLMSRILRNQRRREKRKSEVRQ